MKKFFSIFLVFILSFTMCTSVFANDDVEKSESEGTEDKKNTSSSFDITITSPDMDQDVESAVGTVLGAMQWVGYALGVGMVIYIGIKYIMASADEKASLKNAAIKYILGALLIVSASSIASWVFNDIL